MINCGKDRFTKLRIIQVTREDATISCSTFCLRHEKDDQKVVLEDKDLEIIGSPIIKYGDSTVIMQHAESSLWLSYKSYETKKKGVGKVEEKQAILHEEGKMDDGLDFSRSQEEESKTARVIRKCSSLFTKFITWVLETNSSFPSSNDLTLFQWPGNSSTKPPPFNVLPEH